MPVPKSKHLDLWQQ